MNSSVLKAIIGAKAVLLLAVAGYFGKDYIKGKFEKITGTVAPESAASAAKTDGNGLPILPAGEIAPADASEIRAQLEFLRKDAETRIASLAQARKTYEVAKTGVDEQLKRIEEERKFLEETLQKEKKIKEDRLSETMEFVSKMEPKKAAAVMEGMDRDSVILLLRKLPARFVTKALEAMSPKKAVEFMEYYTRIRSGREYALMKELGLCKPDGDENGNGKAPEAGPSSPAATATGLPVATPATGSAAPSPAPASAPSPEAAKQP